MTFIIPLRIRFKNGDADVRGVNGLVSDWNYILATNWQCLIKQNMETRQLNSNPTCLPDKQAHIAKPKCFLFFNPQLNDANNERRWKINYYADKIFYEGLLENENSHNKTIINI